RSVGGVRVGVGADVAEGGEENLGAASAAAVHLVAGDRRAAVGGRCAPGERDGAVAGGRRVEGGGGGDAGGGARRGPGRGAARGPGGGGLGRAGARGGGGPPAGRVHGGDLVVVGHAVRHARVGVAGDAADGREQRLAATRGAAVDPVGGDPGTAVGDGRVPHE